MSFIPSFLIKRPNVSVRGMWQTSSSRSVSLGHASLTHKAKFEIQASADFQIFRA